MVLIGPAAALPEGLLAIPQALLLLLSAGPAPKGAASWPCDGLAGAVCAWPGWTLAQQIAAVAINVFRIACSWNAADRKGHRVRSGITGWPVPWPIYWPPHRLKSGCL